MRPDMRMRKWMVELQSKLTGDGRDSGKKRRRELPGR
jgi:hypothetical protein